jgi:plastocyanin
MAQGPPDIPPAVRAPRDTTASERALWAVVLVGLAILAVAGPYKMVTHDNKKGGGSSAGSVVRMAGLRFSPSNLVVAPGAKVSFVNDDVAPHTITARNGSVESGTLKPGTGTFQLTVAGRLDYVCSIHPSMTGKIEISG